MRINSVIYIMPKWHKTNLVYDLSNTFPQTFDLSNTLETPSQIYDLFDSTLSISDFNIDNDKNFSTTTTINSSGDTNSHVSISDNSFANKIRQYWKNNGVIYKIGDQPLYEVLYSNGLITKELYNKNKSEKLRPLNANYGSKHSNHKRSPINLGEGKTVLHAYDISKFPYKSYGEFLNAVYSNPYIVDFIISHGIGILEEFATDDNLRGKVGGMALKRATGATGDHTHWGPDRSAKAMTIIRLKRLGYPVPNDIYKEAVYEAKPLNF